MSQANPIGSTPEGGLDSPIIGACHRTGWTGVIAKLIELFGRLDAHQLLDAGSAGGFAQEEPVAERRVA